MVMIHCEKGHENPDGALFCKECGLKLEENNQLSVINYQTYFGKPSIFTQIPIYFIGLLFLIIFLSYGGDLDHFFNYLIGPLFAGLAILIAIPFAILFYIKHDYNRKRFFLTMVFNHAKKEMLQYTFLENRKSRNQDRFRMKYSEDKALKIYDTDKKEHIYLLTDKIGQTVLIGKRDPTIDLIRNVFGSQLNFIEI
jgi:hypothetical protein